MASLDFDLEKRNFKKYYESNRSFFEEAKNAFIHSVNTILKQTDTGEVTKIEGRVKDKDECIKKFKRKYQHGLEANEQPYEIKDYLSDLIGIRIVSLYEDQIDRVATILQKNYKIIEVTNKTAAIENTEDLFGYKGLHMDLQLGGEQAAIERYQPFAELGFEVQIRSLIQDAWSVLDHKIKYKKSIPNELKRRINVLSALFELADREFKEIRNATTALMEQETSVPLNGQTEEEILRPDTGSARKNINVFTFLRIAGHFFKEFEFESHKVDNFVQDILKQDTDFSKADLHTSLIENLKTVKEFREHFLTESPESTFSPYTAIRHCLYLYNRETFSKLLSQRAILRFSKWLKQA